MRYPVDVLVAIPAHDEAATIVGCLDAVVLALAAARRLGMVRRARIAVVAHRCRDDTFDKALVHLGGVSDVESVVRAETGSMPVGAVRTRLITDAVGADVALPPDSWILSTDADTVVPPDWVTGLLSAARAAGADLVLGLAELDDWSVDDAARSAYRELIDAGIHGDRHDHVYAANLAVSWSAFAAVGGFPAVPNGEEHALVRAMRAAGRRVTSPLSPRVATSARMPGRAADGLGDLLARLAGLQGEASSAAATASSQ